MTRTPRKLAFLLLWPLLVAPSGLLFALGLGEIRLNSALNQPLDAEIELVSATAEELRSLTASVASPDTFKRYGLDRPVFLSGLSFTIEKDAAGRDVLKVRSGQSITEPFLTFIIEANWSRGRLLREYTVLLDPPVYLPQPQQAAPAAVAPPAPAVRQPQPVPGTPVAPSPQPQPQPVAPSFARSAGGDYQVQRSDTLWEIARRTRPDADVNQMMMALYRANPHAFFGTINDLKAGVILRIPDDPELSGMSAAQARATVSEQYEAWRASRGVTDEGRLVLVAAEEPGTGTGTSAASSEALSEQIAENQSLQSQVEELQAELDDASRLIEFKDSELAELQQRLADITDRLAAAGEEPLTGEGMPEPGLPEELIEEPVPEPVAEGLDDPEAVVEPAPEPVPDEPVVEPTPRDVPKVASGPVEEKGWLDSLLGFLTSNTWIWAALGVAVVLGGAVAFILRRRRDEDLTGEWEALVDEGDFPEDAGLEMQRQAAREESIVVVEEPGEFEEAVEDSTRIQPTFEAGDTVEELGPAADDTIQIDKPIDLDESDPLAEADFHMAYGLYDQAAELVKSAAERHPDNRAYQLKLLEIYFVWGNKDAFLDTAKQLHASPDGAADGEWDKILIMGKQICPEDSLFAATPGAAVSGSGAMDLDLAGGEESMGEVDLLTEDLSGAVSDLDIDFGEGAPAAGDTTVDDSGILDFPFDEEAAAAWEPTVEQTMDQPSGAAAEEDDLESTAEQPADLGVGAEDFLDVPVDDLPQVSDSGITMETPTIETEALETDVLDDELGSTLQTRSLADEIEAAIEKQELGADETAEVEVDDLGLDLDSLATTGEREALEDTSIADEGTIEDESPTMMADLTGELQDLQDMTAIREIDVTDTDSLGEDTVEHALSAGIEDDDQISTHQDDETMLRAATDTLVLGDQGKSEELDFDLDLDPTGQVEGLSTDAFPDPDATGKVVTLKEDEIDLDLDDLSTALGADLEDTTRQRGSSDDTVAAEAFSSDVFADSSAGGVDLDVGDSFGDENEDPTGTEKIPHSELALPEPDPETLSEVGTKLDLARAYMDMGDPEGARSILEEVLEEGDDSQQQDARKLLEALP